MKTLILLLFLSIGSITLAHGEGAKGPHGGLITMPAGFHIEAVNAKNSVDIYLLNINFKDPVIKNSKVEAIVKDGKKSTKLTCKAMQDHFNCSGKQLSSGVLLIRAKRAGDQASIDAEYQLPLK